jgi:23S rRNA (adenine2503-C2)-methyltransferase
MKGMESIEGTTETAAATWRFKDQTAEDLHQLLADSLGPEAPPLRLLRQLQSTVTRTGAVELPERMPTIAPRVMRMLRERVAIPRLKLIDKAVSPVDGFAKYVFEGAGPGRFEAVRIPLMHRPGDEKYVVCVSSQVGCAMGCVFCATGRMGFQRNLATWEIVDQVISVQQDSSYPVRGVVFMGMGEPLLNYDAVIRAARVLSEPCGPAIASKSITISTVGIVPAIQRFTREGHVYRLIVSLTSAQTERRLSLLPVERVFPLPELIGAIRDYHAATRRRPTLAWTVMSGVNTSRDEARALAELTRGLPVLIDLIDVNDATGQFQRASPEELKQFRDYLSEELGMPVQRRYSGGLDIHGACGMLAARFEPA